MEEPKEKQCVSLTDDELRIHAYQKLKFTAKYAKKAMFDFIQAYNELPEDLKTILKEK